MTLLVADDFHCAAPVFKAGAPAIGVWTLCATWSAAYRTEGLIPDGVPAALGGAKRHVQKLADSGLWVSNYGGSHLMAFRGELWDFRAPSIGRPAIPTELRRRVYDRDGWQCVECGSPENLSLDHIWPYSRGGEDVYENLQTMCRSCNSRKGARV